jgi:hypothetical protein
MRTQWIIAQQIGRQIVLVVEQQQGLNADETAQIGKYLADAACDGSGVAGLRVGFLRTRVC